LKNILAVDIGSYKTTAIIANYDNEELTISGVGIAKSKGIKKGAIINIDHASRSIKQRCGKNCRSRRNKQSYRFNFFYIY